MAGTSAPCLAPRSSAGRSRSGPGAATDMRSSPSYSATSATRLAHRMRRRPHRGLRSHGTYAQPTAVRSREQPVQSFGLSQTIAEASARFGVPARWIAKVMQVESRGDPQALSPKGAIGLMQIMPATYASLAARYGLGADPWNVRDNIMAGAAYLRELYDRYGASGFLAAYNAGPGRWEDHLSGVRPLPGETVRYLSRLGPSIECRHRSRIEREQPSRRTFPTHRTDVRRAERRRACCSACSRTGTGPPDHR